MSFFQVSGEWGKEALLQLECVYGFLLSFAYFFFENGRPSNDAGVALSLPVYGFQVPVLVVVSKQRG